MVAVSGQGPGYCEPFHMMPDSEPGSPDTRPSSMCRPTLIAGKKIFVERTTQWFAWASRHSTQQGTAKTAVLGLVLAEPAS